jgi:hypothetical protein
MPTPQQFLADQSRYAQCDPYHEREIELKLSVADEMDPATLAGQVESALKDGRLGPFAYDPFWTTQKGYVGSGFHLVCNVFGRCFEDGHAEEAFRVVRGLGVCRIREKTDTIRREAASGGVILDRREVEQFLGEVSTETLLDFIDERARPGLPPIEYVGSYARDLHCLACLNTDTGHRYALMADRSVSSRREGPLQQLEVEYIWRRVPLERPFTREEIYTDMLDLAGRLVALGARVLRPTHTTKFAWLMGAP